MVDATKRKLTMPAWHIPYLERHRIYELFHELAREVVIQQPIDHVLFLKQILFNAVKNRDTARVIILASPKVNTYEVARQIATSTKQTVITEKCMLACANQPSRDQLSARSVAKCLAYLLRTENVYGTGWILVDCIQTAEEAQALLDLGITPTHVIHLIPPYLHKLTELLYCNVSENWPHYRRTITNIRETFKQTLVEVFLQQRYIQEIVDECIDIIRAKKGCAPLVPRVLLLGPRGSGRKTQAKLLVERLKLVHVEFEALMCQAWISESDLGDRLRQCKDRVCFRADLLAEVINQRILEPDCLQRGWVLTSFPNTISDFRYLDSLDTPPNRVIFLECEISICRERLIYRKFNMFTGTAVHLDPNTEPILDKVYATHPKDKPNMIDAELKYYCENYGSLRSYCGGTANMVSAEQPQRWTFECITAIIVRAPQPCRPRNPCVEEATTFIDASSSDSDSGTKKSCPVSGFVLRPKKCI